MGRRKREPRSVHRNNIASVASKLFMEKGILSTSMDDIAKAAGYSKATLYAYFENKEEIVSILVLDRAKYDLICQELVKYQKEYPFYFKMTFEKININFENQDYFPEEKETFQIGEEINEMIKSLLVSGIENGDLRRDIDVIPTSFSCWGMLSGLIHFATNKEDYIQKVMKL